MVTFAAYEIVKRAAPTPTCAGVLLYVPSEVVIAATFEYVPVTLAALAVKISVLLCPAGTGTSANVHVTVLPTTLGAGLPSVLLALVDT